jgi:cyclase
MRSLMWIAGGLIAVVVIAGLWLFQVVWTLEVERVTDDVFVIHGVGGNVGVLRTGAGSVIVDTMTFPLQGERIRERAEELTGEPVAIVINTHYHADHTHGNPAFEPGTRVVATKATLHHLKTRDAEFWQGDAAENLPNETIERAKEIKLGNKTVRVFYLGDGHTNGDLVAWFMEDRVVHLGDLLFYRHYPRIDIEAGGSAKKWGDTLDQVFALDFDHVIPGHGKTTDAEGLRQFQAFMHQLARVGEQTKGLPLDLAIAEAKLTEDEGYEPLRPVWLLGITRESVIGQAWQEARDLDTL